MSFRSKNLLVTGGCGFIGSNFIEYIFKKYKNVNVINLDSLTYASNSNTLDNYNDNKRYFFVKGNICDEVLLDKIFKKYMIDGVINFAAESHVDNSILNPDIFLKTNINGVLSLLKTCRKYWYDEKFNVKSSYKKARFHQVSTDEVYGSIDVGSSREIDRYSPNSPYSASKASADLIVRSFNITYNLNTTISISSNNFGKNQHNEKFIPKVIQSISDGIPIPIYGDGLNVRDWIFVLENCKAIDLIFNLGKSGDTYNVGGKNQFNNLEIVEMIHKIILEKKKCDKHIKFIDDRPGHDRRYSLNINKIMKKLGWIPNKKNFKKNFRDYILNKI